MKINIPLISAQPLEIDLKPGERLFIVGVNGAGKSALLQHFVLFHIYDKIRRISAHRQMWLDSGDISLTPKARKQIDESRIAYETKDKAQWTDHNAAQKQMAVLFDLVAHDNDIARSALSSLYQATSQGDNEVLKFASEVKKSKLLFEQLNELLALGTLTVSLENSKGEEIFARHKKKWGTF